MQKTNKGRQLVNDRLQQHLHVNTIRETEKPIYQKGVNQISQSAPNRFDKLTTEKKQQWPLRRLQTDLYTYRSLSTCPTYSSLSPRSPETCNCATQITTLTSSEENIDHSQYLSSDSLSLIDNHTVVITEEDSISDIEIMPIASGSGFYPYNYPTTKTKRIVRPEIVIRANKFRDRQNHAANAQLEMDPTGRSHSRRPTDVKNSSNHSDFHALPTKRNEANHQSLNDNHAEQFVRRAPQKERSVRQTTPPQSENRREKDRNRNGSNRKSSYDEDSFRRPSRFISKHNDTHRATTPPASYRQPIPLHRNENIKQRHVPETNEDYIIERRRKPTKSGYDDYQSDSPYERRRPQKVVRVVHEPLYRDYYDDYYDDYNDDDYDDEYYIKPPRRPLIVRRAPPREYVVVDAHTQPARRSRSRHSDVVYVDDKNRRIQNEDESVYVDQNGNEIDVDSKQIPAKPRYVEYIYDDGTGDEADKKQSPRKTKVIYVGDKNSSKNRDNKSKPK